MRMARNIYHRKDGRFEARYIKGYDKNGKKKYGTVYAKTYTAVKEKLTKTAPSLIVLKSTETIVEAVTAHLESLKYQIKPSTQATYQRHLEKRIIPYFGNTRCDRLTSQLLQNFIDTQVESGFSVATVQSVFSFLKAGLKIVGYTSFPVKLPKKSKTIVEYLSFDEQKRLEAVAKTSGDLDYLMVMLCLYSGIRVGEASGLFWSDIDYERRLLKVRRTMQRIKSSGATKTEIALLSPKTSSSVRDIPLPDFLFNLLKEYNMKSGSAYVLSAGEKFVEPRTLQRRFKKLLIAADVKEVNFHATRHTFATRALESGFDVKSLSEIMGHSSAMVTLTKYAHALDKQKRTCMEGLSTVFNGT
jgi:integrase